jgi:hypothetical protein
MAVPIKISNLQVKPADRKAIGLLDENSITQMYKSRPYTIDSVISAAFAAYNENNTLEKFLDLFGNEAKSKLEVGNREIQWDIILPADTGFTIDKAPSEIYGNSVTNLGIGFTEFKFGMYNDPFVPNDVCTPDDDAYQFDITGVTYDGLYYIYSARLSNDNVAFMPSAYLEKGRKITKRFTSVAENSTQGGKPVISSNITLRNSLTTLRQSYAVTRSARTTKNQDSNLVKLEMRDPSDPSKTTAYWATVVEWEARRQWMNERMYAKLESVYNQGVHLPSIRKDNESNRPILRGAGLLNQISPSNIFSHNGKMPYEYFEEICTDLARQISNYGSNCELTLFAGLGLRKLITDGMIAYYSSAIPSNILTHEAVFLSGQGNELVFKAPQVSTITLTNDIKVKIIGFKMFNDTTFYKKLVVGKNQTLKSYEGFFVNMATVGGKSNLQTVVREMSENMSWTVEGSFGPLGRSTNPSSPKDGYEIHTLTEENILIKDPIGSARILPLGMKTLS